MNRAGLAALALATAAAWPAPAAADEPTAPTPPAPPTADPPPAPITADAPITTTSVRAVTRQSLALEPPAQAWRRPGFRLGLGAFYGELAGYRGAPGGKLLGASLRTGVRLDRDWSLLASFGYARASEPGGLSGLRFAGTVDPTYHPTPNLSVAVGVGFGGIVEGRTGRVDPAPLPSTLETSYTFPDARTPLASCSGVGAAALVRGEWAWILGPRTQTGVVVEIDGQWTRCVDDTGRVEADTGQPIVRRQYWGHTGVTVGWGVTWR